jgi:hypothetical protein
MQQRRCPTVRVTTSVRARLAALILLACMVVHQPVESQQAPPINSDTARTRLDLSIFDAGYNVAHGGRAPSMQQALDLTVAQYELAHGAIAQLFGARRFWGHLTTVLYDFVSLPLPLADAWLHEEFHRAQMGSRGIDSFNDVYRFQFGGEAIYVSHVSDDDITSLKRQHPAEWIRVNEAGIEGELSLGRELETRQFLGQGRGWHLPLYWLIKLQTLIYVESSTWDDTDADTDLMNAEDGMDVPRRDFTGHDLLAWTYDLHRPAEPYTARGVHPSGVGIDRYVKLVDLTPEERRYIRQQGRLHWLNFADPFLLGIDGVRLGGDPASPTLATMSLAHFLTAFGYSVEANVLVRRGERALSAIIRMYANQSHKYPGLEMTAYDLPVRVRGHNLAVTPRVMLWLQPRDLAFRADQAQAGVRVVLRARPAQGRLVPFIEIDGKTEGWVAGTPYLGRNLGLRLGVSGVL